MAIVQRGQQRRRSTGDSRQQDNRTVARVECSVYVFRLALPTERILLVFYQSATRTVHEVRTGALIGRGWSRSDIEDMKIRQALFQK